jgi:tRNA modification GTPase
MDFDDDEEGVPPDPLHCVARIFDQIGMLLKSSRSGRFRSKGLTAVIAGKPNVGKSTLFNALLGTNRMIISPQPGTTRDPVSEKVFINGVAISLGDTAGIRDQPDSIEREGINRTLEWIDNSDIAIVVIDSTQAPDNDDLTVLERVGDKPGVVVLNKIDRAHDDVMLELEGMKSGDVVRISARTGEGLKLLSARIADLADSIQQSWEFSERGSLNDRALLLMESAHVNLGNAIQLLAGKQALELVSFEIKSACDKIDEITGRKFTEDVLDRIFERFCVGK